MIATDRWDRITAGGGRLLAERCDASGHWVHHGIYRYDHPSGARSYLCEQGWIDRWLADGRSAQQLLQD